jgi:hypothetical protein
MNWLYTIVIAEAAAIFGYLVGFGPAVVLIVAMALLFWLTAPPLPPSEEEVQLLMRDEDDHGPLS